MPKAGAGDGGPASSSSSSGSKRTTKHGKNPEELLQMFRQAAALNGRSLEEILQGLPKDSNPLATPVKADAASDAASEARGAILRVRVVTQI